ncbi:MULTISPECIES: pullulanase-type alpha-1,6-glucosidase [unclassified Sphingomonas]|uniref:pullulanase-type alpha-1,6-glucosidase n=3 Tax=Sphingomonas TaxID=13687 RepID=UPI0009EBF394|nr:MULTISPECIES: pullulanase-type alpha-1,6-glucosidase [unclassified Sphingomonas]
MSRRMILALIAILLPFASAATPVAIPAAVPVEAPARPVEARAHWLTADLIAWRPVAGARPVIEVDGAAPIPLIAAGTLSGDLATAYPHLRGLPLWRIAGVDPARVRGWLKGPVAMVARDAAGRVVDRTGVQTGGVIDALFATDAPLGVGFADGRPTLALWAPTARAVRLHLFDGPSGAAHNVLAMTGDAATGVWHITGERDWNRRYYLYEVEVFVPATGRVETNLVTDPYSLSLAADSARSQIVDLADADTKPAGWDRIARVLPEAPEDRVFYELHVRDFSIADRSVAAAHRGGYLGFADPRSAGMRRLRALARSGLSDVHLLPTYDCATIAERARDRREPGDLSDLPPDSDRQQAAVEAAHAKDGFNWCYDPWHYLVPEGSYATDPDGIARIREFRRMVAALADAGLGTVLDVVFNHTTASGQHPRSVLDRIVPGYYHRLDDKGAVTTSTCCANTASERRMMERLMIDAMVVWARDYKVAGFRFDLMGHHGRDTILRARDRLARLTLAKDGVDGARLYIYGEGWNFGEVADDARFVQATQRHMGAGTGVGTFNDRLRDALRGGGPADHGATLVRTQGFASGLFTAPNAARPADDAARVAALAAADQVRAGLAASLSDYRLVLADGTTRAARELDYHGAPFGYVSDPQETINYAEAHDNHTLFDSNAYKLPPGITAAERVRWQNIATSVILLAQGVPFIHAGQERLRSKSLDRNSFDSGDWFNLLDADARDNGWARGLPPRVENGEDWPIAGPLLADPRLRVDAGDIARAQAHLHELLKIRRASPLLRLRTGAQVRAQVHFEGAGVERQPGLIVMALGDSARPDMVVTINASREARSVPAPAGARYTLHRVQRASDDAVLRSATWRTGRFEVPALTTAIWVARPARSGRIAVR